MDDLVKLPELDAYGASDTTTLADPTEVRETQQQAADAASAPNARTRRELDRYLEERALEKELESLWQ